MKEPKFYNYEEDLARALEVLESGGVVLYPTDTIWGLGCDATDSQAVRRIYEIKRRSESKSMISLLDSYEAVESLVEKFPKETVESLVSESRRPLTVIYNNPRKLAPELLADDGSAGLRVTDERFSKELCRRFGKPIVSTSANISGEPSPSKFSEISEDVKKMVDYIVNYGRNEEENKEPSIIVKILSDNTIERIR